MTTKYIIEKLVNEGKLKRFEPYLPSGEVCERDIFMTVSLFKHIEEGISKKYGLDYGEKVKAHLVFFIRGGKIRSGKHIKEVEPFGNGVWAFRILESPQTRIFGGFIEKDVFIAFYMDKRSSLNSSRYRTMVERVKNQWRIIIKEKRMLASSNIGDLISNGVNHDQRKK